MFCFSFPLFFNQSEIVNWLDFNFEIFCSKCFRSLSNHHNKLLGRSIIVKKGDGSQVKESTDSSTTLEDDDIKGRKNNVYIFLLKMCSAVCIYDYSIISPTFIEASTCLSIFLKVM